MAKPLQVLISESERYRKIMLNILTRDSRLRSLKVEVIQANDGEEAVELFLEHKPDLLITELLLPRKSGFEVIRAVRQDPAGKEIPILLTTGLTRDMTTVHVLKRNFDVMLQSKPFTPWDFALNIQKILAPLRNPAKGKETNGSKELKSNPSLRVKTPTDRLMTMDAPGASDPGDSDSAITRPGFPETPGGLHRSPSLIDIQLDVPGLREDDTSSQQQCKSAPTPSSKSQRFTQGNLAAHPLPELLLDAKEKKLSGTLALRLDKVKKVIYILSGHPIYVQSNLRRETIGQTLVRNGMLTAEQNSSTLTEARKHGIPYGQAVVKLNYLTGQQIKEELVANIRYKIESSLNWSRGNWLFVEDHQIGARVPRCILDPVKLVFGGLKRSLNVEQAMQRLASYQEMELHPVARMADYRETFIGMFGDALINALSPGMNLTEVVQSVGNPHETLFQVDILLRTGLLRLKRPKKKDPEAPQ